MENDIKQKIFENCGEFIERTLCKDKLRFALFLLSPWTIGIKKHFSVFDYEHAIDAVSRIEDSLGYRLGIKAKHFFQDRLFLKKQKDLHSFRPVKSFFSIIAIVKNEGSYIAEWLNHYQMIGVDHIYLFDNGSSDDTYEQVSRYIESGFVSYINWPGEKAQLPAYRFACKKLVGYSTWVSFLDADEFLFCPNDDIKHFLSGFSEAGIGVNWVVFGPCGHKERPSGGVVENYTKSFKNKDELMNLRIKTIARPERVYDISSQHYCIFKGKEKTVDENHRIMDGSNILVPGRGRAFSHTNEAELIRINHYITKSEEELREKCNRGYPDGSPNGVFEEHIKRIDFPLKEDDSILRFYRQIKGKEEFSKQESI